MEQSDSLLQTWLETFSLKHSKPTDSLVQHLIKLTPEEIPELTQSLNQTLNPRTQLHKIQQILRILLKNKSINNTTADNKQLTKYIIESLTAGITGLQQVQESDRRVSFLKHLKPIIGVEAMEEMMVESFRNKNLLQLLNWCIDFKSSVNHDRFRKLMMNCLKEEFLVDIKNWGAAPLKFQSAYYNSGLLTDDDIVSIFAIAENLLKRSDNNIEVLFVILEELSKTKIIHTQLIQKLVEQTLPDMINSSGYEKAIKCIQMAGCRVDDPKIISYIIQVATKGISKTNDENKKYAFLSLIKSISMSLKNLSSEDDKQSIQEEALTFIINQVGVVLKDDQLVQVMQMVEEIYDVGALEFKISAGFSGQLRKVAQGNKYASTIVNLILIKYIQIHKQNVVEQTQFNELVETVFNWSVAQNLKNFEITVSQPLMFLSGLKFILLYLLWCEDDAPAKLIMNIHKELQKKYLEIFCCKSHFGQLKYLSVAQEKESQLVGEVHLLLYSTYIENFGDRDRRFKFEYFMSLFTLVSFSAKQSNKFNVGLILESLRLILEKKENGQAQLFMDLMFCLRWFLYSINPMKRKKLSQKQYYLDVEMTFRSDRLNNFISSFMSLFFINNISQNPEYLNNITTIDNLVLILSHPFISRTIAQTLLTHIKKLNLQHTTLKLLLQTPSASPYFWTSEYGLQSHQNRYSSKAIVNFCTFLVGLGARNELFSAFQPILDPSNIKEWNSLEVVNDDLNKFIEHYRRYEDPAIEGILQAAGLAYFTNAAPADEDEEILRQEMMKSKGGKRGQSIQLMDENEAAERVIRKHKSQFTNYYNLITQYLPCFLSDQEAKEWFIQTYLNKLSLITVLPETKWHFQQLILPFLRSFSLIEPYAQEITELLIERALNASTLVQRSIKKLLLMEHSLEKVDEVKSIALLELLHMIQLYFMEKNDYELRFKQAAVTFILNHASKSKYFEEYLLPQYFEVVIMNINICAHVKESFELINMLLYRTGEKQKHILRTFEDLLNLAEEAKIMALRCLLSLDSQSLPNDLGLALKLKVLQEQGSSTVINLSTQLISKLPTFTTYLDSLPLFDFTKFARMHAREHLEICIRVLSENMKTPSQWKIVTTKIINAATELEPLLEEEQLLFFPYWASVCLESIPEESVDRVIDLLVGPFTRLEDRQHLVQSSIEAGVSIIKYWGSKKDSSILAVLGKYMKTTAPKAAVKTQQAPTTNKKNQPQPQPQPQLQPVAGQSSSISAVIFLGVLSPYLSMSKEELLSIQQQILGLFRTSPRSTQVNLAKCLGSLLVFFPDTQEIIEKTIVNNRTEVSITVKVGNSFLIAGLLRGLGVQSLESLRILETMDEQSGGKRETQTEKEAILFQIEAIVEIFGRLMEPYLVQIICILMKYFGDGREEIRKISINATRLVMERLSGYGVKVILPYLFQGIEESKAWRGKIANIWALGNMAHCSPKQLSSCLPVIVSCISKAISDTHPQVRESANESLQIIGSTIQNPEISQIADILIKALSNPFDENLRGLEVILATSFGHYIDAPALSLLIPIIDYGLRSLDSTQKQLASKLVGCLPILIHNADDLVPYMDMIVGGLEVALGDPLIEVRSLAAKAIGQMSAKIGAHNTEKYFKFVWDTLNCPEVAGIRRSGAANSLAEIACSLGKEYFEDSLVKIFDQIHKPESFNKEGYVGVFVYMPGIKGRSFEPYVKDVLENISELVSHDEDVVRNITLRVLKILINNYAIPLNELLYPTLNNGMMNEKWKLRNAAVILTGEMLFISMNIVKKQLESPQNPQYLNISYYNLNLMLLYILRNDDVEQVRSNATQIWKGYIDNTPRCVKRGLRYLVRSLATIIILPGLHNTALSSLQNFCQKYGESHLQEVLNIIDAFLTEEADDLQLIKGSHMVLTQLYRFSDFDVLNKYKDKLLKVSRYYILSHEHIIKSHLFQSVGMMITKLKNTQFLEDLIHPYLVALENMTEEHKDYQIHLEIFDQLCELNSPLILSYLVVLILAPPLEQYKIDILTNNAKTFARVIYTKSTGSLPMNVLFDELYNNIQDFRIDRNQQQLYINIYYQDSGKLDWPSRTQSLVYCIGQLGIHLNRENEDLVAHFLKDLITVIESYSKPILELESGNINKLIVSLEMMQYFLFNTSQDFSMFTVEIIPKAVPYLFLNSPLLNLQQHNIAIDLSNKILLGINNTIEPERHFDNLNILHTCFFNRVNENKFKKVIPGINQAEGDGVEPYVDMIINCLVHGNELTFQKSIEFLQILVDYSDKQLLQIYILRLVGANIRVLNYNITTSQKIECLKVMLIIQSKEFDLSQFSSQLGVTYFRLIGKINQEKDGLKLLVKNYAQLFSFNQRRNIDLNDLMNKCVSAQTMEMRESLLQVIKNVLRKNVDLFSKPIMERAFTIARQLFVGLSIEKAITAFAAAQLGQILAITSKFTSPNIMKQFMSNSIQNKDQSPHHKLMLSSYLIIAHESDWGNTLLQELVLLLTSQDIFLVNQILRNLYKLKVMGVGEYKDIDFKKIINIQKVKDSEILQNTFIKYGL